MPESEHENEARASTCLQRTCVRVDTRDECVPVLKPENLHLYLHIGFYTK